PQTLLEITDKIKELDKKRKDGSITEDEILELQINIARQNITHEFWNTVADNAVDNSSILLSTGEQPKYPYNMLSAFLVTSVYRGQYKTITNYEQNDKLTAEQLAKKQSSPEELFDNLSSTVLFATSLRHGQFANPEDRVKLLQDLPKTGVYPTLLKNFQKPEMSGEECFWDLYDKCKEIANLTPPPSLMLNRIEWTKRRDAMQERRNEIHEEIFAQYSNPLIEQMIEDAKTRAKRQGEWELSPNPCSRAPKQQGKAIGEPKSVGDHESDALNGKNENPNKENGQGQEGQDKKPTMGGLNNMPSSSGNKTPGGAGGQEEIKLDLGDGRSLEELSRDTNFEPYIEQIKEKLKEMFAKQIPIKKMSSDKYRHLPTKSVRESLDRNRFKGYLKNPSYESSKMFYAPVKDYISTVGDIVFAIDLSGSMGWGKGSQAEAVIKSSFWVVFPAACGANYSRERVHT
ncbi:MAG: hypothetical protein WCJ33_07185, partial [Pseudomonadota bacterium]